MPEKRSKHTKDVLDPAEKPLETVGRRKYLKIWLIVIAGLIILPALYAGYLFAASPEVIRKPLLEHYHFRMQIVVDGKAQDFGSSAYQTPYAKDQCDANLPEKPIHFHDDVDQFTHIHWEGMTGGTVMKYYGWNFIGGLNGSLGYRLEKLTEPHKVPIHGRILPPIPKDVGFYVYTGDENSYKERSFEDWKQQDLEKFFGTTSNFPAHESNQRKRSLLDNLFPIASAHGTANDADGNDGDAAAAESEKEKLTRINNLIGNVVIFAQKDEPSDQQIKDNFGKLVPLRESSCGG